MGLVGVAAAARQEKIRVHFTIWYDCIRKSWKSYSLPYLRSWNHKISIQIYVNLSINFDNNGPPNKYMIIL